jgi:hypothetical protein
MSARLEAVFETANRSEARALQTQAERDEARKAETGAREQAASLAG